MARRETVDSVVGSRMATEPNKQGLIQRYFLLLSVLARAPPRGRDVNALLTLGFKLETIANLVGSGLATVRLHIITERALKTEVACVRITDAGWRLLESFARRSPLRPPEDR